MAWPRSRSDRGLSPSELSHRAQTFGRIARGEQPGRRAFGDEPVDAPSTRPCSAASDPSATLGTSQSTIATQAGGGLPLQPSTVEDELVDNAIHDGGVMDRNRIFGSPLDGLLKLKVRTNRNVRLVRRGVSGRREAMWSVHVSRESTSIRSGLLGTRSTHGAGDLMSESCSRQSAGLTPAASR